MLKLTMGLWLGWCILAAPAAYADTGDTEDTGTTEDTGEDTDTGATEDTGTTSSTTKAGPTYGAAELAGDSGNCATIAAVPAAWMLGCVLLVLARRRKR